jgi:plastocyanin
MRSIAALSSVALSSVITFAAMAAMGAEPTGAGTIAGAVRYTGEVPPVERIVTSDGSTIEHHDLVVHSKTKGLRYVVVVLADAPPQPKLEDAEPILVDQVEWVFTPRVVAVQHGQPVHFENSDSVNHSVMTMSTVARNQFNLVAGPGTPIVRVFEPQRPPVMIGCSLHPWMRAWVYIFQHPWFAVTDSRGRFRIADVPPGRHTLRLLHPDSQRREEMELEIRPQQELELNIEWTQPEPAAAGGPD